MNLESIAFIVLFVELGLAGISFILLLITIVPYLWRRRKIKKDSKKITTDLSEIGMTKNLSRLSSVISKQSDVISRFERSFNELITSKFRAEFNIIRSEMRNLETTKVQLQEKQNKLEKRRQEINRYTTLLKNYRHQKQELEQHAKMIFKNSQRLQDRIKNKNINSRVLNDLLSTLNGMIYQRDPENIESFSVPIAEDTTNKTKQLLGELIDIMDKEITNLENMQLSSSVNQALANGIRKYQEIKNRAIESYTKLGASYSDIVPRRILELSDKFISDAQRIPQNQNLNNDQKVAQIKALTDSAASIAAMVNSMYTSTGYKKFVALFEKK
ncbi:MAG: hypothetical protein GF308_00935 [Candidatus Heimdallarchaeota archaeon]|nr:hypothetical protein [Candidatus Heimdallarchaeota archaeon]